MSSTQSIPVSVEILDKEYMVSCPPHERESLVESAKLLNDRMRRIKDAGKVLGTERMAVITALNLVHELLQGQREQGEALAGVERDIQRLEAKIREAMSRRRRSEALD